MSLELFKTLCKFNQEQLLKVMGKYLRNHYDKVKITDKYIIAEGDLPICLCAHLDTVGTRVPEEIYYDESQQVMWSPQLLGADDRAGVYAILSIMQRGFRPSIIFTTDEEKGAIGAQTLVMAEKKCPLENLKAIIQLDRRGSNDSVYYDFDNNDFKDYIDSFGFEEALGTFSDISVIGPAWEVPTVNLSVGYYDEHNYTERIRMNELGATIDKVCEILKKAEEMPYFTYKEKVYIPYNYRYSPIKPGLCEFCLEPYNDNFRMAYNMKICENCYEKYCKY